MKYFTNLFVFLSWYLEKISDINAASTTQEEQIQKLRLSEKWNSDLIPEVHVMIALKRNVLILKEKKIYNIIYSENTTRISETETNDIGRPRQIIKAPDGVFGVPSYTITSAGKICQLDVSDPMKPVIKDFINDESFTSYSSHAWINENEFLIEHKMGGMLHFGNKNNGETKEWNSKKVSSDDYYDMFAFQYDPKSFVVLYSRSYSNLLIMWPEDAEGNPGHWRNEKHIKEARIKNKFNFITSADVNNDGKTDLLVSLQVAKEIDGEEVWYVEVRAYEIPHSEDFKNPDKYTEHVLISYSTGRDSTCVKQLKAFIPFVSYKGKQWILVDDSSCFGASYLQPENDEVGNWSYKRNKFFSNNDSMVWDIEVADIDQDGYTELFLLLDRLYVYSFSNRTITDPPSTPSVESNIMVTTSSSSILYLDSTLPMFIGLAFPLRLL